MLFCETVLSSHYIVEKGSWILQKHTEVGESPTSMKNIIFSVTTPVNSLATGWL